MGGKGSGRGTDKEILSKNSQIQKQNPIAQGMFIPNLSGDLSRGKVLTTPTLDTNPVNKKYVDDEIAGYVKIDGTTPLTGTWNAGYLITVPNLTATDTIEALRYFSVVTTGLPPYSCESTTVNTNLNADLLDGNHAAAFLTAEADTLQSVMTRSATTATKLTSTLAIGTPPFEVTSTTVNSNLNADLLDGLHATDIVPQPTAINQILIPAVSPPDNWVILEPGAVNTVLRLPAGVGGEVSWSKINNINMDITTTTLVSNLNADLLDSRHSSDFQLSLGSPSHGDLLYGTSAATGGTITTSGNYTIHTFNSNGNFVVTSGSINCDILIVAGGGGGGSNGGGGGAGGYEYQTGVSVSGTAAVVVGTGGAGAGTGTYVNGTNGVDSSFGAIVSKGGGCGGGAFLDTAGDGGSGGGGGWGGINGPNGDALGTQGYDGGDGLMAPGGAGGGGGGGASEVGGDCNGYVNAGAGGDGLVNSITGLTYAGGGGGGAQGAPSAVAGTGGAGGGGAGGDSGASTAGTDGLGGGGGGGGTGGQAGADGGDGRVIVRYLSSNNSWAKLAAGAENKVLTMISGLPVWA